MKFVRWLSEETRGVLPILAYAVLAAFLAISLSEVVQAAAQNWGLIPSPDFSKGVENPFKYESTVSVLSTIGLAPLMEEFMFRAVPLTLVIAFVSESPKFILGTTMVFAILFGAMHPYHSAQRVEIAISGFLFGVIFLKCGGLQKAYLRGYLAAVTAHAMTNIFVYAHAWWNYLLLK